MSIPAPLPTDAEDVSWALSTALTLWNRNERGDAVVWVKRASKAAALAQDDDRAIDLARAAAALSDELEAAPAPAATMEVDVEIEEPPPSMVPLDDADFVDAPAPAKPPPRKPPPPRPKTSAAPPSVGEAMSVPPASSFDSLEPVSLAPPSAGAPAPAPASSPAVVHAAEPPPAQTPAMRPPRASEDEEDEGPLLAPTPSAPLAYQLRSASGTVPGGFGTHPLPAPARPAAEEPKSEPKRRAAITVDGDLLDEGPPPEARTKPPSAPRQRVSVQAAPPAKHDGPSPFHPEGEAPSPAPDAPSPPMRAPSDPPAKVASAPPPPKVPSTPPPAKVASTPPPPKVPSTPPPPKVASTPPPPKVASTPPPAPVAGSVKPAPKPPKPPPPRGAMGSVADRPPVPKVAAFAGRPDLGAVAEVVDLPDAAREELEAHAQVLHLTSGMTHAGFGLAFVIDGSVDVSPIGREPCTRLSGGRTLRAHSSLGETLPLQLVGTAEGGNVATWTPEQVDEVLKACSWVEFELSSLSDAVHAVAGGTSGAMSQHLDAALRSALVSAMAVRAVAEGEVVAAPGETVPGVFVPGVGSLELFADDRTFGSVGPGEFLFAMDVLGGAKAQRGARGGKGGALVLFAERKSVQDLILRFPPLLNLLTMV